MKTMRACMACSGDDGHEMCVATPPSLRCLSCQTTGRCLFCRCLFGAHLPVCNALLAPMTDDECDERYCEVAGIYLQEVGIACGLHNLVGEDGIDSLVASGNLTSAREQCIADQWESESDSPPALILA